MQVSQVLYPCATLMKLGMWIMVGTNITHVVCHQEICISNISFAYLFWLANIKKGKYLESNRKQFVDYNSHISELKLISSGMPQGSILGPLGFIIYVNDIPNSVPELSLILYADDHTSAFTSHKDISELRHVARIDFGAVQDPKKWTFWSSPP